MSSGRRLKHTSQCNEVRTQAEAQQDGRAVDMSVHEAPTGA